MTVLRHLMPVIAVFALAACGGGTATVLPSAFLSGGVDTSGNGLPPADGTQEISDLEGETMRVRLARFVTDHESGLTTLVITDEEVLAGAGYGSEHDASFVITVDGTPVTLIDGAGIAPNGQELGTYLNTAGTQSGTVSVYGYAYGDQSEFDGDFDSEAYHAFGFETSPDAIAARSGTARYDGVYYGFGQVLDAGGSVIATEYENNGFIGLLADFGRGTIGGAVEGTIRSGDGSEPPYREYSGTIATTSIVGNGFGSAITLNCPSGATCESSSLIGGAFYGADAGEVSGVMGFDEALDGERYVGAAGFTAVR